MLSCDLIKVLAPQQVEQQRTHNLARTEALCRSSVKARIGAYRLEAYGTFWGTPRDLWCREGSAYVSRLEVLSVGARRPNKGQQLGKRPDLTVGFAGKQFWLLLVAVAPDNLHTKR